MHTAMAVPSPPTKPQLRAHFLAVRRSFARALSPGLRGELERQLLRRVLPHLENASTIAAYHPMRDEIDPGPIVDEILGQGRVAALPWFAARDATMMFREAPARDAGPWGVLQPAAEAVAVAPEIVLVPLVAADAACSRIGHGKGHYDRALSHLRDSGPVRTIGLAWDEQIFEGSIPADAWDIPLDAIASPGRWIER